MCLILQTFLQEEMDMKKLKPARLILGGGAALGYAHIGVLKALQEEYIIKGIVGTSMGAIIGGLYAYGYSPEELYHIVSDLDYNSFLRIRLDVMKNGILNSKKIQDFFSKLTNHCNIEKCKIPFAAIAFDLKNRQTQILNSGSLSSAMLASSNLPFLNRPYKYADGDLVDGGICYPLPIEFSDLYPTEYTLIAVNVLPDLPKEPIIAVRPTHDAVQDTEHSLIYNAMISNLYNQANLALVSLQQKKT